MVEVLKVSPAKVKELPGLLRRLPLPPMPGIGRHVPRSVQNSDYPELMLLYGWLCFAGCIGAYSVNKVMLSNTDGAYLNVNLRGDYDRQADKGQQDFEAGKHSLFWRAAQWKVDEDGANLGVLWDNRTRPHQYSKPGEAGLAAGLSSM
ncbi:hypothetical protein OEZ85_002947 [Tetradesmus obliquus]|uniref:Uncharacterized protein n=1 Tax=Tetradesmus obliquus TaxID=3088 RepID=A0ABY8U1S9_TETOB|nr:hypothetical protein OEZ85_002947 [Tetradesmus obliquus]